MSAISRPIWIMLGAISIAFHLWLIFSGLVPNLVSRPIHMVLALPWALIFVAKTRAQNISGVILTVIGLIGCGWIVFNHGSLADQYGFLMGNTQIVIAAALLGIVLEMARRAIGWPLPMVAGIALLYALFGEYVPGEFGHAGLPVESMLGTLTIAEGGLWGSLTGVSVSIVAIFVIFGAVLNAGEAGQGFMNVAGAAAGRLKGGAAKVSVISSALFGSISGSASANVASTGAITLPAMTRLGYPKRLAAAVEAVASSGGQIMPPLMGAGAFVMVELTGRPYVDIMVAATLPAFLYFLAVWVGINAFAMRFDLPGVPKEDRPTMRAVIITSCFFLVPFTILLWGMFGGGYTPQYSACLALVVGAALLLLSGSGGMLWPALLLTALACLILGMEVPTTAAYVICVSVAGPALIELGLDPLQAHLFVFWFALLSTITPPVCGAVFIAAGMVEENWLKVAGTAMALGIGLYIVPLAMVANASLIDLGSDPVWAIAAGLKVAVGLTAISYGLISPRPMIVRIGLALAGAIAIFAAGI